LADSAHERGDRGLAGEVETVERLVEQKQLRPADERLGDQEPLLLAAGELADRLRRVAARPDELEHLGDAARLLPRTREPRQRDPPARAVEAEAHEVDPPDPGAGVEVAPLRQVADLRVPVARRPAEHRGLPGRKRQQAEDGLDERRLAGAVRAEHRHELAVADLQRDSLEDRPPTQADRRPLEGDRRPGHLPVASARACISASSWCDCQSWNRAEAGVIVSVIVVTGMPCLRAASVIRWTSGVLFWLLRTQTLI